MEYFRLIDLIDICFDSVVFRVCFYCIVMFYIIIVLFVVNWILVCVYACLLSVRSYSIKISWLIDDL